MMRVSCTDSTFLTSDIIARSLLELSEAMGDGPAEKTVVVPALRADGRVRDLTLLVSGEIAISATCELSPHPEPEMTDAIRRWAQIPV